MNDVGGFLGSLGFGVVAGAVAAMVMVGPMFFKQIPYVPMFKRLNRGSWWV